MSLLESDIEERSSEHPVIIFFLTSAVVFALLFLLSHALGSSEAREPMAAGTPNGGGGSAPVAEAPVQVATLPAPELAVAPAEAIEPVTAPEVAPDPIVAPPPALPSAPAPAVSATSFAVLERGCGALAAGFNEHARLAPASLTKIVTSLVVARSGADLNQMVDITVSGSRMRSQGSSVMGIEPGQRYSVKDLLYGLMLPSGNDAAVALAQHLGGGNVDAFVDSMNAEAAALGMVDSHFSNPHGLDSRELYSSTYDMALAGRASLDIPLLWEVANTRNYTTASGLAFRNGNKLLSTYPGVFGVKIGFTNNAKQTIVVAAERDGRQVVLSLFGSENRYTDAAALLDWTFDHVPPRC